MKAEKYNNTFYFNSGISFRVFIWLSIFSTTSNLNEAILEKYYAA
jgi:hypothetical protein